MAAVPRSTITVGNGMFSAREIGTRILQLLSDVIQGHLRLFHRATHFLHPFGHDGSVRHTTDRRR